MAAGVGVWVRADVGDCGRMWMSVIVCGASVDECGQCNAEECKWLPQWGANKQQEIQKRPTIVFQRLNTFREEQSMINRSLTNKSKINT